MSGQEPSTITDSQIASSVLVTTVYGFRVEKTLPTKKLQRTLHNACVNQPESGYQRPELTQLWHTKIVADHSPSQRHFCMYDYTFSMGNIHGYCDTAIELGN